MNTAMKVRTIGRHFREGGKNIIRNGWMTLASVGAVTTTLILVGLFLVLMLNLNQVAENVEEDVEIKVLIDLTAKETDINKLENEIRNIPQVSMLQFSSKEEELKQLIESMGEEGEAFELFEQDNPLNDAFIVKTEDPIDTFKVAEQIMKFDNVGEVVYAEDVIRKLFEFNQYARYVGLGFIIALVLTAAFLVSNTIKITIMARSKEIGIMKLVGATNSFIRWPFFIEGLLMGILGSILPIALILGGYYYLYENLQDRIQFPFVELLPYHPFAFQLSFLLLAIGAFIGVWGSVMSVRKFLKV